MKGSKEKEKYDDNENDEMTTRKKIWRIVRRMRKGSGRKKKKNEN